MKKTLLSILAAGAFVSATAQGVDVANTGASLYKAPSGTESGSTTNVNMDQVIHILENIQGHVFLSRGYSRTLEDIVAGTEAIANKALSRLTWTIANEDIASIDYNTGEIYGKKFGQTYVTVHEPDDDDFYLAVFVCPTITVKSAEGAIYTYQKMYGSPAKIQLTQSDDYMVNCVMHGDQDVTDQVVNGYYVSDSAIMDDLELVVSLEDRRFYENDEDDVIGSSGINLRVLPSTNTLEFYDPNNRIRRGANVIITDADDVNRYDSPMPADNKIVFLPDVRGVFNVFIEGIEGCFRIIMQ